MRNRLSEKIRTDLTDGATVQITDTRSLSLQERFDLLQNLQLEPHMCAFVRRHEVRTYMVRAEGFDLHLQSLDLDPSEVESLCHTLTAVSCMTKQIVLHVGETPTKTAELLLIRLAECCLRCPVVWLDA